MEELKGILHVELEVPPVIVGTGAMLPSRPLLKPSQSQMRIVSYPPTLSSSDLISFSFSQFFPGTLVYL